MLAQRDDATLASSSHQHNLSHDSALKYLSIFVISPRLGSRSPQPNHFGLLLSFFVNLSEAGYNRIRFGLFYDRMPAGVTVRIDEAVFNDPRDLELGEHSVSDIEIVDSALVV